jgi:hypothetical protein
MNKITFMQAVELIDIAAQENRLWHYNGGAGYVRISDSSNVLMIIEHGSPQGASVTLHDGTEYFKAYNGAQFAQSEAQRTRESLVEFFSARFTDIISLETV